MNFEALKEQHGEDAFEEKFMLGFVQGLKDAIEEAFILGVTQGLKQAREWRPIETAPLDGTEVILRFVARDGTARPVEVLNGWYDGSWRRICNNINSYQYLSVGDVTHWMPKPLSPKEQ